HTWTLHSFPTRRSSDLDPILGLIPGIGDAAGAVLAAWILLEAFRMGASRATLVRMAGNVALDAGLGAIPVLGDIFDFAWKANFRDRKSTRLNSSHQIIS